jgi:hypothetical protein
MNHLKTALVLWALAAGLCNSLGEFRAAISVKNVTPDPLLPIIGGIGRGEPAKQKRGELTVRALVLAQETNVVAIVSTDFLGFPRLLGDRVRAAVADIPGGHILIGATHTHSAPDTYGFPDGKGGNGADPKYLDLVCGRIIEAIKEAHAALRPAQLKVATGEAQGKIAFNYYAERLYDPRCHVLQMVDANGKPIATLVNYAIHPEVLGNREGILSPDLVGPLYEELIRLGAGVGIFMNSAQGGMVTADNRTEGGGDARSWEECQRIGRLLASEAVRIVKDAPTSGNPGLYCASQTLTLPVDSPGMRALMEAMPKTPSTTEDSVQTQLNLINLGSAQIITIPGEALPNIGYYLKRKMHGKHNLLFGLTNDAFGYILTREDFDSFKRYEYITRTSLGERTGEILVREVLALCDQSPRPPP